MDIVFIGPPASGKGTQAKLVCAKRNFRYLSTGDILRAEVENNTIFGRGYKNALNNGLLASDEIVTDLVKQNLDRPGTETGAVFDGYPRTAPQVEALAKLLHHRGRQIDTVIHLDVPDNRLIERLVNRVVNAEKPRADDNPESFHTRLKLYHAQTEPVINYFHEQKRLHRIDGLQPIDVVAAEVDRWVGMFQYVETVQL